jgi:hypothetical protein
MNALPVLVAAPRHLDDHQEYGLVCGKMARLFLACASYVTPRSPTRKLQTGLADSARRVDGENAMHRNHLPSGQKPR